MQHTHVRVVVVQRRLYIRAGAEFHFAGKVRGRASKHAIIKTFLAHPVCGGGDLLRQRWCAEEKKMLSARFAGAKSGCVGSFFNIRCGLV